MTTSRTFDVVCMASLKRSNGEGKLELNLKKFEELCNNENLVKFAYDTLIYQNLMPSIIIRNKSADESYKFRQLGNDYLRSNDFPEALQLYNLALLHAPYGSTTMALALSNRSAVLSLMKYYKDGLKDIDTVLSMDLKHPEAMILKLLNRKKMCVQALSKQESDKDTNSIRKEYWNKMVEVEEPHKTIPCASSCVEILWAKDMGRHVVAGRDIKVGEVIAVEKPYLSTLYKSQYLIRCYHCLTKSNTLTPCSHCCFVMFCSSSCKEASWTEYHEIECPIMATLVEMYLTMQLQALRVVIKARNECKDWKMFIDKINKIDSSLRTRYRGYVKTEGGKYVYDSKYFNSVHALATNVDKRTNMDLYQKSLTAAMLLYLLQKKPKFLCNGNEHVTNEEIMLVTGGLLLRHLMSSLTNIHGLYPLVESESGIYEDTVELGCAIYAFMSMFNHSCAQNVRRMYRGTDMAVVAVRPIKKGTQLFDNYGFDFETTPIDVRRAKLQSIYKFTCDCDACNGAWPLISLLEPAKDLSGDQRILLTRYCSERLKIESLDCGDIELAINRYPQLCNAVSALDNMYPCFEVNYFQEFLRKCMQIISETVPRCYNRLYKWH